MDPVERGERIGDGEIVGLAQPVTMQLQEAERAEPIVDGDDDGRTVRGEECAVIVGAAAGDEGAAMDEEQHR